MKQALVTVAVTAALILLVGSPITGGPDTSSRKRRVRAGNCFHAGILGVP